MFEKRERGLFNDLAVGDVDLKRAEQMKGLLQPFVDLFEAVIQAAGEDEYFPDGDQVLISFFGFIEMFKKFPAAFSL